MKLAVPAAVIYLLFALMLEVAILPQLELLLPEHWRYLMGLRLLALGAILMGMLRGEAAGMLTGLGAALLLGFATRPDWLGASIVGMALAGYLAGQMGRRFRLSGPVFRAFVIFLLLAAERYGFFAVQWFFWRNVEFAPPWPSLLLTALLGTILYRLAARRLKRHLYMVEAEEEMAGNA